MATLTDTTPRGHRAWQSRLQGSAMGLDRRGFLSKVASAGMSDFGKTCRSTTTLWMSCLPQLRTFTLSNQCSHFRLGTDL